MKITEIDNFDIHPQRRYIRPDSFSVGNYHGRQTNQQDIDKAMNYIKMAYDILDNTLYDDEADILARILYHYGGII